MSSIEELKVKRELQKVVVQRVVEETRRREARDEKQRSRQRTLADAVGGEQDAGAEIAAAVKEIAELLTLLNGTEADLRRAQGDESVVASLCDSLAEIESEIAVRKSKGDGEFITLLAELERADHTTGALLYFGRKAVRLGFFTQIDERVAQDHIRRSKEAKERQEMLMPEAARPVWRVYDTRERVMVNFITIWFPPTDQSSIARTKAFGERFNQLYWNARNAAEDRREEIGHLDGKCNLIVENLFEEDAEGFIKLDGLTSDNPWVFSRPDRGESKIWGPIYLEVSGGRFVVVLPERSALRRTCEVSGLVSEDGTPKRIAFKANFNGLRAVTGEPLRWSSMARALLCKAAGLASAEEDEPESTRAPETAVGHAMTRAKQR